MYDTKTSVLRILTGYKAAVGSDLFGIDSKSGFDDRLGILPKYDIDTPSIFCTKFSFLSQ